MRRSDNDMFTLADCFRSRLRRLNRKMEPESDRGTVHFLSDLRQLGKRDHQGETEGGGDEQGGIEHGRCPFGSDVSLPLTNLMQFGCQVRSKSGSGRIKVGSKS